MVLGFDQSTSKEESMDKGAYCNPRYPSQVHTKMQGNNHLTSNCPIAL